MMTNQDFEAIAHTLNMNLAPIELVEDMANTLEETNVNFKRTQFIAASTIKLVDIAFWNANRIDRLRKGVK